MRSLLDRPEEKGKVLDALYRVLWTITYRLQPVMLVWFRPDSVIEGQSCHVEVGAENPVMKDIFQQ